MNLVSLKSDYALYAEDLKAGEDYDRLSRCVSIAILDFDLTEAVGDWVRLFNARSEEDLEMIKTKSIGMTEAIEALREMSLSKAMRYRHEVNLKLRRDRKAEDDYVRYCGREEGKAEGKAEDVLQLLRELGSIPQEIEIKIRNEKDLNTLSGWLGAAARAESMGRFRESSGL